MTEFISRQEDGLILVCISDTHAKHSLISQLPLGDVLIHCGDYSSTGTLKDTTSFMKWFDNQEEYSSKIFIAGNHDTTIDINYYLDRGATRFHRETRNMSLDDIKNYSLKCREVLLTSSSSIYLEDSECQFTVHSDLNESIHSVRVYGSPWQPEFCDWAFNANRGPEIRSIWEKIPSGLDILLTHGPPLGYGDLTENGFRCGCSDLLDIVLERPPRVHIFGHIHEAYGLILFHHHSYPIGTWSNEKTLFVNASTCTFNYRPTNEPIVIFLPFDKSLPARRIEPQYPPTSETKSEERS